MLVKKQKEERNSKILKKRKTIRYFFTFLILAVILSCIQLMINSKFNKKTITAEEKEKIITTTHANAELKSAEETGKVARITSSEIIKRETGTGPFDKDNEPGNDQNATNEIVRSFDQVTWTIENTMGLKDSSTQESYSGGVIIVTASLPTECANIMKWDLESMAWAENAQLSDDGRNFEAEYSMSKTQTTIPGKQDIVLVLQLSGAKNNLKINPTFSFKLKGGNETKTINGTNDLYPKAVTTSAAPKIDIELYDNKENIMTDDGNKRLYAYTLAYKILGENPSKGLKGIEMPTGDLTFNITYSLKRTPLDQLVYTDITNGNISLYNYKLHDGNSSVLGNNANKIDEFPDTFYYRTYAYPFSQYPGGQKDERRTVYKNGNLVMRDDGKGTINVTISDYGIDPKKFPDRKDTETSTNNSVHTFEKNDGFISIGLFYIGVNINSQTKTERTQCYIDIEAKNINVKTSGGSICKQEVKTDNNKLTTTHVTYAPGNFFKYHTFTNLAKSKYLPSDFTAGDGKACKQDTIVNLLGIRNDITNEVVDYIYGLDCLVKIDDEVMEPVLFEDSQEYNVVGAHGNTNMKFNVLYAGKTDKTGWKSDDEMINTPMDDLKYFDTMTALKNAGYTCVGYMFESTSGVIKSGIGANLYLPVKIKSTAKVGNVAQVVGDIKIYNRGHAPDRTTQTHTKETNSSKYPEVRAYIKTSDSPYNNTYVKTKYDESGQMVDGTHYPGYYYGNSVLILGADQNISITPVDDNGRTKTNYDLGKLENKVNYKITPSLTSPVNIVISGVNIKVSCTLPKGVLYTEGTCNYGDPTLTFKNPDDSVTLTWYIKNCTVGKAIDPIIFSAQIDETTDNGHQYDAKAVISEDKQNGVSKLGDAAVSFRTATTPIQIINLQSYALYKNTYTPIIEVNGDMGFRLTAINKTNTSTDQFQLLDILPFNGDNRGTSYSGNYTVKNITLIKSRDNGQETVSSSNLKLYITTNTSVRNGITAKNEDLGTSSIWTKVDPGTTINRQVTGIAIVGTLENKTKLEVNIQISTSGNNQEDIYVNKVTAQTNKQTNEIESSTVEVKVIKRKLDGIAWYDKNEDGLITAGENKVAGLEVRLLKENGSPATDAKGATIPSTLTDANGYYKFENMARGRYKVAVNLAGQSYIITKKNVGDNEAINSKFNSDGTTDVIDKLDSIATPLIEKNNVNVGLIYPKAVIKINKTDSITNEKLNGATFGYFEWNGNEYVRKGNMTDNGNGTYETPLLEYNLTNKGKFRIIEEQAPQYYTNSGRTIDIVISEPGYHEYTYDVKNEPNKVMIKTIKIDDETKNRIQGATFTVYEYDASTGSYKEYIRDGHAMTLQFQEDRTYLSDWLYSNRNNLGRFRIIETLAPNGYYGDWLNSQQGSKVNNDIVITTSNNGQTLTISNESGGRYNNTRVKGTITVNKIDKETNKYLAQGDASLDGAEYGLYAQEDIYHKDTVKGLLYAKDQLVQRQTIVKGKLTFKDVEIGKYYVKEIIPPTGYTIDEKEYPVNVNYEGESVAHLQRELTVNEQVKKQAFKIQKLSVNESSTEGLPLEGAGFKIYLIKDLAGVKNGDIRPDSNGNYRAEDFYGYDFSKELTALDYSTNQEGVRIQELFTDKLGELTSPELAYGKYVVIESTVPKDRYAVNPFIVSINDDSRTPQNYRYLLDREFEALIKVSKIDNTTNKEVINKNAAYRIWSITEKRYIEQTITYPKKQVIGTEKNPYRINEEGYFITPLKLQIGEYELREVEAPEGYVLQGHEGTIENDNITEKPSEAVKFKITFDTAYYQDTESGELIINVNQYNSPMMGEVKIIKQGEHLTGTTTQEDGTIKFNYELAIIEGAEFEIHAKDTILSQDNQGTVLYEKDALIGTTITNAQGIAYLNNLPIGKYYIRETQAGYGFVLNREEKEFEIKYQDQNTPTQSVTVNYINERQKIKINGEGGILVEKVADKKVYKPGEIARYTIKVSNTSENDIRDILVQETLINGEFEEIQTNNIRKTSENTVLIGKLKPGETVTLIFKTQLGELEEGEDEFKLTNIVKATGKTDVPDPENPNNKIEKEIESEDDENIYVTDKKLVVIKEALKKQYEPGEVAQYLIHVINNGKVDIANVNVEETLINGRFIEIEQSSVNGVHVKYANTEEGLENTNKVIIDKINPGEEIILRYEYIIPKDIELSDEAESVELPNIVIGKGTALIPKNPENLNNPDIPDDEKYTFEDVQDQDDEQIQIKENDINLGVIKKDAKTGESVQGAIFGLYAGQKIKSMNGELLLDEDTLIEKSTTNSQGRAMFTADLPLGIYYVKEIEAPKGYTLSEEKIVFDATYRGQYKEYILESHIIANRSIDAKIIKKDESGNLLSGALLEIVDENGNILESWTTGEEINIFEKLEKGKIYTLREKSPAIGFTTADKIRFFIGEDGKLYKRIEDDEEFLIEAVPIDFIEMVDEKTKIELEVVDKETKEHLSGIEVDIVDKKTGKVVKSLVTSENVDIIEGLPVGKYDVVTKDPQNRGYVTGNSEIEVRDLIKYQKFVLEQDYTKVEISLKDEETRNLLSGGIIEILDENGNVVRVINTEEKPDYFERLPIGKYRLSQTKSPDGYYLSEIVEIEIKDTPEKQVFEILNRKNAFNMSIEKKLIQQVYNGVKTNIKDSLSKFEIRTGNIPRASFWTIYTVTVRNTGEIAGKATVKEIIPNGFTMYQDSNSAWKVDGKEASLITDEIAPGDYREYEVVLRWNENVLNIGIKENKVSIVSTENKYGFEETTKEDNNASASILIAISTGLDTKVENIILVTLIVAIIGTASAIIIKIKKEHNNIK